MKSPCNHDTTISTVGISSICILVLSFMACLLGTVGCGSANKLGRLTVSGKIILDGQPLDYGSIDFYPEALQGVSAGGMLAKDGSYSIPEAKGLPPGKYVVRIYSAYDRVKAEEVNSQGPDTIDNTVYKERIPANFNSESEQIVEITVAGPNTFDFDIKTK